MKKDKTNGLKIGDRVRYTSEFLRSIGDYSENLADKFGIIEGFEDFDLIVLAKLNYLLLDVIAENAGQLAIKFNMSIDEKNRLVNTILDHLSNALSERL